MSSNIEKILYIGLAVLLLGIAFSFFFLSYNNYQDHITKSNAVLNEDRMAAASEGEGKSEIKGSEVIHQVLEAKRLDNNSKLMEVYSDSISSHQSHAEIWVSGENAVDIEMSDIDNAAFYNVEFEKDHSGRIIKIHYTLR
ncbi:MAG: hypothetical protein GX625_09820 [Clostridiaceae bacterium]|nr:hypothetical protein [Clostridiaceae bacterium]